jgi:tetratricopeptide (TPR) repeat protein
MSTLKEIEKLIQSGELEEAQKQTEHLRQATKSTKLAVLASIALKANEFQKSEALFENALKEDPNNILAVGNYGQLLVSQKQFKRALPFCERVHLKELKNENYLLNYVACLAHDDNFEKAIEVTKNYIDSNQKISLNVKLTLASVYRAYLKPKEALEILNNALEVHGEEPELERALADAYSEIDPKIASEAFAKAVQKTKRPIPLKWNWSFVELRLQNFELGWELYESGLDPKIGRVGRPLPAVMRQFEQITKIASLNQEKYTLLTAEQGLGDQILFLSCLGEMLQNIPKPILICEERLLPIVKRSFPSIEAKTYGFANSLSSQQDRLNGVFPIGSLMKYCRNSKEDFIKNRKPYIKINKEKQDEYNKLIQKKFPGKKIVGLSWSGGYWDRQKRAKSIDFEELIKLIKMEDHVYVSLQYGDIQKYKQIAIEKKLPIVFIDGIDFQKQIDEWVALAGVCEQIISVSTALVHFAGAAGKKIDLILGQSQSPFIWGLEEGISLPYESVKIYRQKDKETREEYINRLKKVL